MIDVPIVALAGSDDRTVLPKSVEEWARRTTSSFQMQTFPGGHFFLRERSAEITSLVFRFMGTRSRVPQAEPSLT